MNRIGNRSVMFRPGIIIACAMVLFTSVFQPAEGQNPVSIRVKTLDKNFKPIAKLGVSINGEPFFFTNESGSSFAEVAPGHLPPKAIVLSDESLEAESWNYSKGTLEIMVRKKLNKVISLTVLDPEKHPLSSLKVNYRSNVVATATTDADGAAVLSIPVSDVPTADNFAVEGAKILSVRFTGLKGVISVDTVQRKAVRQKPADNSRPRAYSITDLDSIRSLTIFYAVITTLDLKSQSAETRKKIDAKFLELVRQHGDSIDNRLQGTLFGEISDSTKIKEDVELLTRQALQEKQLLDEAQAQFAENIRTIERKLAQGGANLSDTERNQLLLDLENLAAILKLNEEQFFHSQALYAGALDNLRNGLMNIHDLEAQLSLSERQRIAENAAFRRRLMINLFATASLASLVIVLAYLIRKVIRQKRELAAANVEVKRVNENLESLIQQRTASLEAANRELDTFFYRSSHNLKRPLTTIMGLGNIARLTLEPAAFALFEKAVNTAQDMDRLLQKLKMMGAINHPAEKRDVDFEGIKRELLDEFQDVITQNNICFTYSVDPHARLYSYQEIIAVVLKNLAENAFFYSALKRGNSAQVKVRIVQGDDGCVRIIVSDNGVGIAQAVQPNIWDMFFIGNESSKGNGLGLYITQKAVMALNGEITLTSVEGEYTEVTVSL